MGTMQPPNKQVYTVRDVSAIIGWSRRTVTRLFEKERGVLILERPESLHKRGYRSIRIPRPVFERVVQRLTVR
jgi:AraC-like DNA-binding protein